MGDGGHSSIVGEPEKGNNSVSFVLGVRRERQLVHSPREGSSTKSSHRRTLEKHRRACQELPRGDERKPNSLEHIFSGVVEGHMAVALGQDVDGGLGLVLLVEKVLVVGEAVLLDGGLGDLVEVGDGRKLGAVASNLEHKVGVGDSVVEGRRSVGGGLNLYR